MKRKLRVRHSVRELQAMYEKGKKAPLEKLMKAWAGIKALPPDDPNSFFMIGGYHGEPFRGAGYGNNQYWGGYCNHGNVLFPTWHRVYMLRIEEALQSIEGCEDVMMAYWDETSEESIKHGIPWALTDEFFPRDSKTPNPLRSFVFPSGIKDNISGDDPNYSKPAGYETVRYPQSGLVGTPEDQEATKKHNDLYSDYATNTRLLNGNVIDWLNSYIIIGGNQKYPTGVAQKYEDCILAPNYTVFSNTTSAGHYNSQTILDPSTGKEKPMHDAVVTPLESPHNSIHLAVGGYDAPNYHRSPVAGANGDMGENDTAGLDPIFFFHHCNVDRMFWIWQKYSGKTDDFSIIHGYPGTNSVDSQGPTPGVLPNTWLEMGSPLDPFKRPDGDPYTSYDLINIETQLGFTYSEGSLDGKKFFKKLKAKQKAAEPHQVVEISNVNRAAAKGSMLVTVKANINGKEQVIGHEAVLSRWNVDGCANCQNHLEVKAHFAVPKPMKKKLKLMAMNAEFLEKIPEADLPISVDVKTRPKGEMRPQKTKVAVLND